MLLNAICTPDVVCCGRDTTALAAARLMRQKHVGDVVVVDEDGDQVPVGIITDRDIVVEVLGNDLDPAKTTVCSFHRAPVVIGRADEDASEALERMRIQGIRRMPVVGPGGKLVGIVTLDDLLKALASDINSLVDTVGREQSREHRTRR